MILVNLSVEFLLGVDWASAMVNLPEIKIVRHTDDGLFESSRGTQSFENFCLIWIFG